MGGLGRERLQAGLSQAGVARQPARLPGAGALLGEFAEEPAELRKAVTSPGGTTAAALGVLMADDGLAQLMRRAVDAAVKRGAELAREAEKG